MFSKDFLNKLRIEELRSVFGGLAFAAKVLEFGAGTGIQAKFLAERGCDVVAIDLASSDYSDDRVYPILEYNGRRIPLPDASVDVVYSSNVLEHVENLAEVFAEFRRVLRSDGYGVHVVPSVAWRFWTFVSGFPTSIFAFVLTFYSIWTPYFLGSRRDSVFRCLKTAVGALLPIGHGTSWEGFSELWTFSAIHWSRRFKSHGFEVVSCRPIGLFHTGHMLLGPRISIQTRKKISRYLGSAATLYVVRKTSE